MVREIYLPGSQAVYRECFNSGVPMYYLTDDNFTVLSNEIHDLRLYNKITFRNTMRLFAGVLAASDPLARYIEQEQLHWNVLPFTPVRDNRRDPSTLSMRDNAGLNVGVFGGDFRLQHLETSVLPALRAVAERRRVRLFARAGAERLRTQCELSGIQLTTFATTEDIDHFIPSWRAYNLDIVIHPRGVTDNIDYKNANTLLVSYYLGAVPIVTDEMAFRGLGPEQGVTMVSGEPASYAEAIERFASRRLRHDTFSKLEVYVRRAFDPERNLSTLDRVAAQVNRLMPAELQRVQRDSADRASAQEATHALALADTQKVHEAQN